MSAVQAYMEAIDAVTAQSERLGLNASGVERWTEVASRFVADPRREPDANLTAMLEYVEPDDVVLDVGGGAGRYGLPVALRCKELINVEPSLGMGQSFENSAREAGISNARWLQADWLSAGEVIGDVAFVSNVTYFVREIVPFIEKLVRASRGRVMIMTTVVPSPNQGARLFELLHGEPQALVPGFKELLPVLWEMGIIPDVRVLGQARPTSMSAALPSREDAINSALAGSGKEESQAVRDSVAAHFDDLFEEVQGGYRRRTSGDARVVLTTWLTG